MTTLAQKASPADEAALRRKGRRTLLLLFAVCAAPVVLGTLAFYFWRPEGRTNYGELLPLTQVRITGTTAEGAPFDSRTLQGQWVLVNVGPEPCDAACEQKLFFTRQVHAAQGAEAGRVSRVWVTTQPPAADAKTTPLVAGGQVVNPASPEVTTPFGADAGKHVFLVDPLGNLMMRFPENADPKRMIKDLQKLLRVNNRGK